MPHVTQPEHHIGGMPGIQVFYYATPVVLDLQNLREGALLVTTSRERKIKVEGLVLSVEIHGLDTLCHYS